MINWRPDNWEDLKGDFIKLQSSMGYGGVDLVYYRRGFDAGANAILEALMKLAKESPTGTFTIEATPITIFREV